MPSWCIYIIIAIVLLIVGSAFASASEIAYATTNKIKLEKAASDPKNKKAVRAQKLVDDYPSLLATILVVNNLVNIAMTSLFTILANYIFSKNADLYSVIFGTLIVLIFGEIIPKTITSRFNYKVTLAFSGTLSLLKKIFKPVVFVATKISNLFAPMWTPKVKEDSVTDEELITMVDEIEEEGFIDEETGELVRSAIDFTDVSAYEIMTHRVDVFAFDIEDKLDDLINDVNIFKYSRVPVYRDDIDHIIGILNTKVLIKDLLSKDKDQIKIEEMLTEPIYVHKTKAISEILREFKKTHTHIAIVVDEFGGTMGIITLEDILEELVGDIWDETDTIEEEYTQKSDDEFIVDGEMNIYDLFDLVEYDDKDFESEYTTVGGWCTDVLGKFPEVGDYFQFANLQVSILEVDGMRVEKVKVKVLKEEE